MSETVAMPLEREQSSKNSRADDGFDLSPKWCDAGPRADDRAASRASRH
jgi:hypothetical protein